MAYQKRYRTVVPVPRNQATLTVELPTGEATTDELLVWLTRESFDRAAAADYLQIVSFTDAGELAADDVPPKAEKQLGAPASAFVWRVFEGVAERANA